MLMSLLEKVWRSTAGKLGAMLGVLVLLTTGLGYLNLLDWVLDLPNNRRAVATWAFIVSPGGRLLLDIVVIVFALLLIFKALKDQLPARSTNDIILVSTSSIRVRFNKGRFTPALDGYEYAGICCFYNAGDTTLRNVGASVTVTKEHVEVRRFSVPVAYWLNERWGIITFKRKTYRHLVVAFWNTDHAITLPGHITDERHDETLDLIEGANSIRVNLTVEDTNISHFDIAMKFMQNAGKYQRRVVLEIPLAH